MRYMHVSEFQRLMKDKLGDRDVKMGHLFLMNVLTEEVGELARVVRRKTEKEIGEELADVIFCAISLANVFNIEIEPILGDKYVHRSLEEISGNWTDVTWK